MQCPKCFRSKFTTQSNDTHYVCVQVPGLPVEDTGCGAQFYFVEDEHIRFPYNVIFNEKSKHEFFRKPYLKLSPLGLGVENK